MSATSETRKLICEALTGWRRKFRDIFREHGDDYFGGWEEYDSAAEWCAKRGLKGKFGDPLPENLSGRAKHLIELDHEAFEQRVRQTAYALAMNKLNLPEE